MNYQKIHDAIINRAKNRSLKCYTESHHIIPRCMGGLDNEDNLVKLTPEEHYVVHQLLVKIYPDNYKLIKAANRMCQGRANNKLYGWLRRRLAIAMAESQTGSGNSQFGKIWIHNDSLKQSKKIDKSDTIPIGWKKGRKINFEIEYAQCKECNESYVKNSKSLFCSKECRNNFQSKNSQKTGKKIKHDSIVRVCVKVLNKEGYHFDELKEKIIQHLSEGLNPRQIRDLYEIDYTDFGMFIKKSLNITLNGDVA